MKKLELKEGQIFFETGNGYRQWIRRIDFIYGDRIYYSSLLNTQPPLCQSDCSETTFRNWISSQRAIVLRDEWSKLFDHLIPWKTGSIIFLKDLKDMVEKGKIEWPEYFVNLLKK
jgi:hypothetical protein